MGTSIRVLLSTCTAVVAACSGSGSPAASEPPDGQLPFTVARSASVERQPGTADPAVLRQQAASGNRFAVALYQQLGRQEGNLFFSPHSIAAALGMTAAGAGGQTEEQMRQALQVTLAGDAFHDALNGLQLDLEDHVSSTGGVRLSIVNSVWAQTGFDFRTAYLDLLARAYGAGVNLLDFAAAPDASRRTINDWVSQQTNQRIEDLLPPGSVSTDTRLVLTNAVYFLAEWLYRFSPALTTEEPFHRLDGSTVAVPLMQLGAGSEKVELEYGRDAAAGVRAVNLYYRGRRLCMTVLLPDTGTFTAYESHLSLDGVDALIARLAKTDLPPVRLPRFTYTSASLPLRPPLEALGMRDAFEPGAADFSGIDGRRDLFVSQVLHKAFVAVDEQGTEAAAATAVVMEATSVQVDPPRFVADRPFVFLIRDTQTGLILFMGRIVDPSQSQ
jgi:serpin B